MSGNAGIRKDRLTTQQVRAVAAMINRLGLDDAANSLMVTPHTLLKASVGMQLRRATVQCIRSRLQELTAETEG